MHHLGFRIALYPDSSIYVLFSVRGTIGVTPVRIEYSYDVSVLSHAKSANVVIRCGGVFSYEV
jgi:hypothetical protein